MGILDISEPFSEQIESENSQAKLKKGIQIRASQLVKTCKVFGSNFLRGLQPTTRISVPDLFSGW